MRFVVPTDKRDVGITYCKTPRVHRHIRCIDSPLPSRATSSLFFLKSLYVNFAVVTSARPRWALTRLSRAVYSICLKCNEFFSTNLLPTWYLVWFYLFNALNANSFLLCNIAFINYWISSIELSANFFHRLFNVNRVITSNRIYSWAEFICNGTSCNCELSRSVNRLSK